MRPWRHLLDQVRGGEARADSPDSGTSGLDHRWMQTLEAEVGCPRGEGGVPQG